VIDVALARPRLAVVVSAAGCALLVARPLLLPATSHPVAVLVALFALLLVAGWGWPARSLPASARANAAAVVAIGVAAFVVGRLAGGHAPAPLTLRIVALTALAAVAEEAFFRRLVYGALASGGPVLAVGGSAVLFALVHVTVYGAWVFPIDLAAGLILSWQRWATGSWSVPAVTHVLANLLVVI
jgi:membrane protease YdiL (CAAX protease family)